LLRLIAAFILLQTGFYKLASNPQAIQLFTMLKMEPNGRFVIGALELIAGVLILIPRVTILGALLGIGLMAGAIFFHLTKLGISMNGDTTLFTMAIIVSVACIGLVLLEGKKLLRKKDASIITH